jgi:hypothetical protein
MMAEYHNDASQAERKEALKADCYFNRAQSEVGQELGRFSHLTKASVKPVPQYPQQPPNSPFRQDPTGAEPPLGFDVNSMTGVAQPDPILEEAQAARVARQLAKQEQQQVAVSSRSRERRY